MAVLCNIPGSTPVNEHIREWSCSTSLLGLPVKDVTVFREEGGIGARHGYTYFIQATAGNKFYGERALPKIQISNFEAACMERGLWDVNKVVDMYYPELQRQPMRGDRHYDNIVVDKNGDKLKIKNLNPYATDCDPRSESYGSPMLVAEIENLSTGERKEVKTTIRPYDENIITMSMSDREAVETYLGDQLQLPAHYQKFSLPDGIARENINIRGGTKKEISVSINEYTGFKSPSSSLSYLDQKAFESGLASKEQLATKYLGREAVALKDWSERHQSQDIKKAASLKM